MAKDQSFALAKESLASSSQSLAAWIPAWVDGLSDWDADIQRQHARQRHVRRNLRDESVRCTPPSSTVGQR